jgi:UDP-2-acetamido-2,6-beta-L-arabino-hexul-4-ose reductase
VPIYGERLPLSSDNRGFVIEPADLSSIREYQNLHIVWSVPGTVRGNHYHMEGTETIVIVGPALLRLREEGVLRDVPIPAETVYRFTIPPGVSHAVCNTGGQPNLLVAFNTIAYQPDQPDVEMDILIEPQHCGPNNT